MANHNAVAHAWANKTGKARKGFNMWHDDETIYSYGRHFPIAKHVKTPGGADVVLFTTATYGVSTAKHKTLTWRACHHLKVFDVPYVRANSTVEHQANYEAFIAGARESVDKAKRARKYGDMHLKDAERALTQANDYNAAFELGHPIVEMVNLDAAISEIREAAKRREEALRREREERQRAQRFVDRQHQNPVIVAWLKGASQPPQFYGRSHTLAYRPFVRVKGEVVETSWGATVPLGHALEAFHLAAKCRAKGKAFDPGLKTIKVGDFTLRRIGPTGNLVVGCHDIPFRHMQIAARLAGITLGEYGAWRAEQ